MEEMKRCPLFRDAESLSMGKGIGYCDIDNINTICEGDSHFCDKPEDLRQYLTKKWAKDFF